MQAITKLSTLYQTIIHVLNGIGTWLPQAILRLFIAWEFLEAGLQKLHGTNWFADITFPFPFNILPPDISWGVATFFEVIGAIAIALGLATRFFAASLLILTLVAIAAVHWPSEWHSLGDLLMGYRFTDKAGDGLGNYKLPLIYLIALVPLIFSGAGKLSLDHLLHKLVHKHACK